MIRVIRPLFIVLFALAAFVNSLIASEEHAAIDTISQKKFNTGDLIFDHVKDSYVWHITAIGHTIIALPLPVILYSQQSGFHAFMASKFHHGTASYQGFKIAAEGKYQGKIVEMITDGSELRPWDFSITKNVTSLFIGIFFIVLMLLTVARQYRENFAKAPKGLQSWLEPIVLFVRDDIARPSIGTKKSEKYLPYLLTIFFFIFFNNLLGLVPIFPGGANLTGNISITLVLALFTFVITNINGSRDYWIHLVNAPGIPWWLKFPIPLMPIVEIMSVFIKPFVLMVRLFANITAGHIIVLGFYSLIFIFAEKSPVAAYGVSVVSVSFSVFMGVLELLVAFIQAYVFTLLSAIYIGMAIETHPHHAGEHK